MKLEPLARFFAVCFLFALPASAGPGEVADRYWPQWRGPRANGVSPLGTPPLQWSENKNVRWKLRLPGIGHSTPIIWGDRVFLTTAVPYGDPVAAVPENAPGAHDNRLSTRNHKFVVLAVGRVDGQMIWQRTVRKELPHEGGHFTGSLASNSPVTDGEHLVAFFGSRGLYSFNLDGEPQWEKDLGRMQTLHAHGEGSSPVLSGEALIVNWDHQGQSFVFVFDKRTGAPLWKVARSEVTSWSTPLVIEHAGKRQVIVSATGRVRGYDLATGDVIWECGGLSRNVVASPVAANGMVYVASSYDRQAMMAIRLEGARGDITGTDQVVWTHNRYTPYVPSPLVYGPTLYFLRHNQGILSCLDTKTGQTQHGPFRLAGISHVFASPVGAANRVYLTDRNGTTLVVKHGDPHKLLARNRLDDSFSASPAIAGGELYLRGQNLYCIAEE